MSADRYRASRDDHTVRQLLHFAADPEYRDGADQIQWSCFYDLLGFPNSEAARNFYARMSRHYGTANPERLHELYFGEQLDAESGAVGFHDPQADYPTDDRGETSNAPYSGDTDEPDDEEGTGYEVAHRDTKGLLFRDVDPLGGRDYFLPLDQARLIAKLYSDMGAGAQMGELADWLGIDREVFQSIKQRMGLTHKSPDLIDEDLERLAHEEIFDQADKSVADKRFVYRIGRAIRERRQMRKELEQLRHQTELEDRFIERAMSELPAIPYHPPENVETPSYHASLEPALVAADLHVGQSSDSRSMPGHGEYGQDVIRRYMDNLKDELYDNIKLFGDQVRQGHLFSLGDWLDGVMAIMFAGQEQEQDIYGDDQWIYGVELKAELIEWYHHLVPHLHVWAVHGNHDGPRTGRLQPNYVRMMMYTLQQRFANYDDITFHDAHESMTSVGIGNGEVILLHGTGLRNSAKGSQEDGKSLLLYSNTAKPYKYVVHGHYHDLDIAPLPRGYRKIQCDALTGGNRYSMENYQAASPPAQTLLLFDRERGLRATFTLPVDREYAQDVGLDTVEV